MQPNIEKMLKKRIRNLEDLLNRIGSKVSRLPHQNNDEQLTDLKVFINDNGFCMSHQCFDCDEC